MANNNNGHTKGSVFLLKMASTNNGPTCVTEGSTVLLKMATNHKNGPTKGRLFRLKMANTNGPTEGSVVLLKMATNNRNGLTKGSMFLLKMATEGIQRHPAPPLEKGYSMSLLKSAIVQLMKNTIKEDFSRKHVITKHGDQRKHKVTLQLTWKKRTLPWSY